MTTDSERKYRRLELRHCLKEILLSIRIAFQSKELSNPQTEKPLFVFMVDGKTIHGGMCDRFKGIITLYAYCKYLHIPFRIRYTYPFQLEDYLSPASYDWSLRPHEYTDNPLYCRILYMRKEYLARRLLKLHSIKKQIHFYSNRDCLTQINKAFTGENNGFDWGTLFRELFKPTPILRQHINLIKKELGGVNIEYYAAVFRFQNLLGDFQEYHYQPLDNSQKAENLIKQCLNALRELKSSHEDTPWLVTSDSRTFLERVTALEGVHIIPGSLIHIDGAKNDTHNASFEMYLKSFVDFYMLTEAKKIYRIGTSYMYPSEFPVYAAKVHNIPFESITIK